MWTVQDLSNWTNLETKLKKGSTQIIVRDFLILGLLLYQDIITYKNRHNKTAASWNIHKATDLALATVSS